MRALSTKANADNGTSYATCREVHRETTRIAVHMKVFSTGPDLGIRCGSLPPPEPREVSGGFFPQPESRECAARSPALALLEFPRCSVSSRQSRELRTCSPSAKLARVVSDLRLKLVDVLFLGCNSELRQTCEELPWIH